MENSPGIKNSIPASDSEAITNCQINPERLTSLTECLETYDIAESHPAEIDWLDNVLATRTVVYDCGAYCRSGDVIPHHHDPAEFALCQKLAAEAAVIMQDQTIEMGDEGEHDLAPFYVVINQGSPVPMAITEEVIRSTFGGTIYPQAQITICPLEPASGQWWTDLNYDYPEIDPEGIARRSLLLAAWQVLIDWYHKQSDLTHAVFVAIDLFPFEDHHQNGGCVFPRLVLGLTKAGSLVGLSSCVVHT
jgi:hypothetical protein